MLISILIVTHNSASTIVPCLQSLHLDSVQAEIIIVDNASSDSTHEAIASIAIPVQCISNGENVGFAAAINQAARRAQGDFLLLLNPDAIVEHNFFAQIGSILVGSDKRNIIGTRLINAHGEEIPSCWKIPTIGSVFLEALLPYFLSIKFLASTPQQESEVATVTGACMIIPREIFLSLGGFDERFFLYYEDFDFCLRARKEGHTVWFTPRLVVQHDVRKSSETKQAVFFHHIYRSKLQFIHKHYGIGSAILTWLLMVVGILWRIPVYTMAGFLTLNRSLISLGVDHLLVLPGFLFNPLKV